MNFVIFCFTKKNIVNSFVVAKLICQVEPLREQHLMKKYCKKLRNTNKRWPTWNVYSRSSLSSDLDFLLMVSIKRVVCINNLIMFAATYNQINNISQLMFDTMKKSRKPSATKRILSPTLVDIGWVVYMLFVVSIEISVQNQTLFQYVANLLFDSINFSKNAS